MHVKTLNKNNETSNFITKYWKVIMFVFCSEKEFACRMLNVQIPVAINRDVYACFSMRWRLAIRWEHSWMTNTQSIKSEKDKKNCTHTAKELTHKQTNKAKLL